MVQPLTKKINALLADLEKSDDPDANRPFEVGDRVEIKGLNVNAAVIGVAEDGVVELQMGNARIELNERQLRRVSAPDRAPLEVPRQPNSPSSRTGSFSRPVRTRATFP